MKVKPIQAFLDNYIWVIEDKKEVVIVDPGEAEGVLDDLEGIMPQAVTILLTHNHDDHIGGVEEIVARYPDTVVYGPVETEELNDVDRKSTRLNSSHVHNSYAISCST